MDMLLRMNWVDLLVVIIMLRTIYISFQDGLSHELFPLFGSVLKLVLALHFYGKLGSILHSKIAMIPLSVCNMVSFLVIVLIATFALNFLKTLIDTIIKVTWHPLIEKSGGILVGVLRGAISVSMVLIFLALVPLSYLQWSIKDKSLYGGSFLRMGPAIYRMISGNSPDSEKIMQDITSKKDVVVKSSKEVVKQPEWEKVFNLSENRYGGKK